jgi:hypothetical protein
MNSSAQYAWMFAKILTLCRNASIVSAVNAFHKVSGNVHHNAQNAELGSLQRGIYAKMISLIKL